MTTEHNHGQHEHMSSTMPTTWPGWKPGTTTTTAQTWWPPATTTSTTTTPATTTTTTRQPTQAPTRPPATRPPSIDVGEDANFIRYFSNVLFFSVLMNQTTFLRLLGNLYCYKQQIAPWTTKEVFIVVQTALN